MIDVTSRVKSVTDREQWAARGATFLAKVRATKAVWFPPAPVKSGTKAATTAKKTTKKAAGKTAGTARKTAGRAKRAASASKT